MNIMTLTHRGDTGEARVCFEASDPVFAGHFPQSPVLPGVVLIDAVVDLVSRVVQCPLRLERLSHVKFCKAVLPDQPIDLSFKITRGTDAPKRVGIQGRWSCEGEKVADLKATAVSAAPEGIAV